MNIKKIAVVFYLMNNNIKKISIVFLYGILGTLIGIFTFSWTLGLILGVIFGIVRSSSINKRSK